jgi:hypothetical protein
MPDAERYHSQDEESRDSNPARNPGRNGSDADSDDDDGGNFKMYATLRFEHAATYIRDRGPGRYGAFAVTAPVSRVHRMR